MCNQHGGLADRLECLRCNRCYDRTVRDDVLVSSRLVESFNSLCTRPIRFKRRNKWIEYCRIFSIYGLNTLCRMQIGKLMKRARACTSVELSNDRLKF